MFDDDIIITQRPKIINLLLKVEIFMFIFVLGPHWLCLEVIPGSPLGALGTIRDAGDETQINTLQSKCPPSLLYYDTSPQQLNFRQLAIY